MRDPEKLKEEMDERKRKILDVAFELFVDKKIEAVSMGEISQGLPTWEGLHCLGTIQVSLSWS